MVKAPVANAFSIGSGIVVITEPLLLQLRSEAELAAVISHEMAHQILGHTRSALAEQVRSLEDSSAAAPGTQVPELHYSLEEELAADALGLKIMFVARYDLSHALAAPSLSLTDDRGIFSNVSEVSPSGISASNTTKQQFRRHSHTETSTEAWLTTRTAYLQQQIEQIGDYRPATETTREFSRMKKQLIY